MKVIIFLLHFSNHEYLIRINFEAVTNKLEEVDSKSILRKKYFFCMQNYTCNLDDANDLCK